MPTKRKHDKKKGKPVKDLSKSKIIDLDVIVEANSQEDPFAQLTAFHSFSRNELSIHFKCCRVTSLDKPTIDWTFDLLSRNMQSLYESSSWGWHREEKFKEMTEDAAWYLIAYNEEEKPVAFSHFRFDMDYDIPVLYWYSHLTIH